MAEPPELLLAFVAHYLDLGADEVHLCLDHWDNETLDRLAGIDRLRLTLCDDRYWADLGMRRPPDQESRQIVNAQAALNGLRTDWLFFCDADEFLCVTREVKGILQDVPQEIAHARVEVAERLFPRTRPQTTIFDGTIRGRLPDPGVVETIYGRSALFLTDGLTGHPEGKSFVRRDAGLSMRLHFPIRSEAARLRSLFGKPLDKGPLLNAAHLVHFDGMTLLHWLLKLRRYGRARAQAFEAQTALRRMAGHAVAQLTGDSRPRFRRQTDGREAQISLIAEDQPEQIAELLSAIAPDQPTLQALGDHAGALPSLQLDPAATLSRQLPGCNANLTAAAFDARLRQQHDAAGDVRFVEHLLDHLEGPKQRLTGPTSTEVS